MKVAKFFALIFAVLGIVLLLVTTCLSFLFLDRPVGILQNPDGALLCSEQLQQHVNAGDLTAVAQLMYGQPSFGAEGSPEDPYSALIWDAFRDSFSLTYTDTLYLLDSELARDGVITMLDIPALMQSVQARSQILLEQKAAAAQEESAIYDADGNVRGDIAEQILQEAVQQALEQDASTVSRNVTIRFIHREDRWCVLPDQSFLTAITGLEA